MALILKHQSAAQFVTRVREAYRNGRRDQLIQIARFIIGRIQSGDLTDAQCRNAFGLTSAQWTTLKAKMQTMLTAANTVESAVGE